MKFHWKLLLAITGLCVFTLLAGNNRVSLTQAEGPDNTPPNQQGPIVSEPVRPSLSPKVRQLSAFSLSQPNQPGHEVNPRQNHQSELTGIDYDAGTPDPLLQAATPQKLLQPLAVITSFNGIQASDAGGGVPPDTNGDVGPNHYVQMVNVAFTIYDKNGTLLTGPTPVNALWQGAGGQCESNNDGDPIVLYDPLADRWLLTQFVVTPPRICAAVSQTPDPTGAYNRYEFTTDASVFPDYFKFGVWPDAYYMSANENTYTAYAFDRVAMLAGSPATFQKFTGQTNLLLPSDVDGSAPPPAGSPNYFYTFKDDNFHGGIDRLEVFAFHVDWVTPANSTFTLHSTIPVAAFTYTVCGFFVLNCIPQPAAGENVDAVSEWPMWRFPYRNFGNHEALVGNFAIDVGSNRAGIRWFELRRTGGTWTLFQQGTHAPDANHRFMGSIAMDHGGNIALGYSVSSNSLNPAIRYAIRLAGDTPGTLQPEATLIAGGGVQTNGGNRWGDYSAMSVDPADDCTFWYTNEYYATTSQANWQTRIGAFKLPECISSVYLPIIRKE